MLLYASLSGRWLEGSTESTKNMISSNLCTGEEAGTWITAPPCCFPPPGDYMWMVTGTCFLDCGVSCGNSIESMLFPHETPSVYNSLQIGHWQPRDLRPSIWFDDGL